MINLELWGDGSYDSINEQASWGYLLQTSTLEHNPLVLKYDSGVITDKTINTAYQIGGELKSIMEGLKRIDFLFGRNAEEVEVKIYYDYTGIKYWATKDWKAKKPVSKQYVTFMEPFLKKYKIVWVKVKAHSGVANNEYVDGLARKARN